MCFSSSIRQKTIFLRFPTGKTFTPRFLRRRITLRTINNFSTELREREKKNSYTNDFRNFLYFFPFCFFFHDQNKPYELNKKNYRITHFRADTDWNGKRANIFPRFFQYYCDYDFARKIDEKFISF